jgi:pyrimidine deaminase RibD-like protein
MDFQKILSQSDGDSLYKVPIWKFSKKWINSVTGSVNKSINVTTTETEFRKIVFVCHQKEWLKLRRQLISYFRSKYSNIDIFDIEDVIENNMLNMVYDSKYNPEMSSEEVFLKICISNDLLTFIKKTNISRSDMDQYESTLSIESSVVDGYLMELIDHDDKALIRIINHLKIISPEFVDQLAQEGQYYLNYTVASKQFLFDDVPDEFIDIVANEDLRINVYGYSKYEKIILSDDYVLMNKAIELLQECRENFYLDLLPNKGLKNSEQYSYIEKVPLLSAIAVDSMKDIIKTAYKGETGCMDKHCEFMLLEEMLDKDEKSRLIGGALYVTLEPCNKRGMYFDGKVIKPKIPCAVRCVESGISKIFIGTRDPDNTVNWTGAQTLMTGSYKICLDDNGDFIGDKKEKKSASLLMDYFISKGYKYELNKNCLVFKIGGSVEVDFFPPELSLKIMNINKEFLWNRAKNAFSKFDYSDYN